MKQESDFYDQSQNDRKLSVSKSFLSRQIFGQQNRKKRRMHTNSILNELRLNQKINYDNFFIQQQKSIKRFQSSRKSSLNGIKSRKRMSEFNVNLIAQNNQSLRISNFCQLQSKKSVPEDNCENLNNDTNKQLEDLHISTKSRKNKQDKQFIIHNGKKKANRLIKQPRNNILSSINNKLREIDVISKTFDKVNEFYGIDYGTGNQNYQHKNSQTFKILKDFESKLALRKNMITQRKNSFKKNTKIQYRYKVAPKRYQTQALDKQNYQQQSNYFQSRQDKYQGIWHEDARKLKNYISGGYTDQKQQYSDFCDLEQYRSLKKNFRTFQQIYNSIKEDTDNPIGKVYKNDFKQPNIIQIVSVMEKQQQLDTVKLS